MSKIVRFDQVVYEELLLVEQRLVDATDRPEVKNKVRKMLFFLFREGFFRTLNKIKSKSNTSLQAAQIQTLIIIKQNNRLYANLSTQSTSNTSHFVIENIFYSVPSAISFKEIRHSSSFNQFVSGAAAEFKNSEAITLPVKNPSQAIDKTCENGVFLYGLGDYSRVYIAPNIKKEPKIYCVDYNYDLAEFYKKEFNYKNFGLIPEESYSQLQHTKKPLAIIATYHSDHTSIAEEIFSRNRETLIFIEKPPCVTLDDVQRLSNLYEEGAKIEIGYNRRYIPLNRKIKELYFNEQKVINISVKEILINENHWYFWENQGTRITGNLTHWIDLCVYWINGKPVEANLLSSNANDETIAIAILFSEGSLVNITVSDKGNSLRGVQERIEIRTKDETFVIEDYIKYSRVKKNGYKSTRHSIRRQKGHDLMYRHLTNVYNDKANINYCKEDLEITALTTFYIASMFIDHVRNLNLEEKFKSFSSQSKHSRQVSENRDISE